MIRLMQENDWQSVSNIYGQGIEKGKSTFNTVVPSYKEWDAKHLADCRLVFIIDECVVAWAAISPTSGMYAYRGVVEISLYVDDHFQGQGIGTQLLQALISETEKCGYWCLYSVICSVNTGSLSLHKKCGFRTVGYREKIAKDRFGHWQNTTIMERRSPKMRD